MSAELQAEIERLDARISELKRGMAVKERLDTVIAENEAWGQAKSLDGGIVEAMEAIKTTKGLSNSQADIQEAATELAKQAGWSGSKSELMDWIQSASDAVDPIPTKKTSIRIDVRNTMSGKYEEREYPVHWRVWSLVESLVNQVAKAQAKELPYKFYMYEVEFWDGTTRIIEGNSPIKAISLSENLCF